MTDHDRESAKAAELRRMAEARASTQVPRDVPSIEEMSRTLHDLQVHQIELELQNEELVRIQIELAAARARYFDLYDLAPVGYCTINGSGVIVEINLTATALLGLARNELIGRPLSQFIFREDQDNYYLHFKQIMAVGDPQQCELRMMKSDGGVFWAQLEATAADDADGTIGCRMAISDITRRKDTEVAQARFEQHLQVAQKMEAIGHLAGGVAHDFNNMLAVIIGNIGLLLEGLEPDHPLRGNVVEIGQAADRSAAMTHQLLAFSRKQVLQPKLLNLNEVACGLDRMLGRLIGEHIEIHHELSTNLGPILADPGQIEQVIVNLAVNARDAMPGGGRLIIATANVTLDTEMAMAMGTAAPGSYVSLTVTDDGCGMDDPTATHIFEPFFTTKEVGKGTGLGLATVFGIVKQSNGEISVRSVPGKGTTFQILFPQQVSCVDLFTPSPEQEAPSGGQETILVVEDEELVRKVALRILGGVGYHVLTAASGVEGLRLIRSHAGAIDLVLTDMVMPQMSGQTFVKALREIRPGTRVLFMSGYSGDSTEVRGILAPDTGFIGKPFRTPDLVAKVRGMLDVKKDLR